MTELITKKWNQIGWLQTDQAADELAFQRVIRLCQDSQARLAILNTLEEMPDRLHTLIASLGFSLSAYSEHEAKQESLDKTLEVAANSQVAAHCHTVRGRPLEGILQQVVTHGYDLLMKSAQSSYGIRHVLLGHLDRQLIRKCPCPVWIEKPATRSSHDRILAAVDPAPFADVIEHNQLNVDVLRWASYLAEIEHAQLDVVHVWPFHHERRLHGRGGFSDSEVAGVGAEIRRRHETALNDLIEPFRSKIQRVHLLKGDAAEEISRLAARQSFDVVVMGTVCRSGIQGLLIGNTAETVLDQIDCSVVALKPPGFVSPVGISQ
ncbi:universal stress protein [Bremerella alba]|uniref:UspA domain-containing protein n=1 Tax=Bremerella alba TaxID=980252 RepID=A0A7V9A9T3_9BACT|nr:universal stress protein [Bremerella alba]MBA2117668.1 hypothetical protein [Bremerella alba]